jgi:hypothetical protein
MSELGLFPSSARRAPSKTRPFPAPLVVVSPTLFVIEARYFHPITGAASRLPPHAWLLGAPEAERDVVGAPSDGQGIASIPLTDDVVNDPGHGWTLVLMPFPAHDPRLFPEWRARHAADGEIWIDLDTHEWVFSKDVRRLEKRRLLRLPLWTSTLKAATGGFDDKELPPSAQSFARTGQLRGEELRPFGTRAAPWKLALDHEWYRSYVQFQHYDHVRKNEQGLPPGLVIEAVTPAPQMRRVGAGTALDVVGLTYVLHARTAAQSTTTDYSFRTDEHTVIDLAVAPPALGTETAADGRMVKRSPLRSEPKARRARYLLPKVWHSHRTEARYGDGARDVWEDHQRSVPTRAGTTPFVFHLDDTVLVRRKKGVLHRTLAAAHSMTILDHHLAVRDPDPDAPTNSRYRHRILRAEESVFVKGRGLEAVTLVVHQEGLIHLLREEHMTGRPGIDGMVGARAAVHGDIPSKDFSDGCPYVTDEADYKRGNYHLYLVPDAIEQRWDEVDVELSHLIVLVGVHVEAPTPAEERSASIELQRAALHWDQLHPAHSEAEVRSLGGRRPQRQFRLKDYRIVPTSSLGSGARVVKLRHLFPKIESTEMVTMRVGANPDAALAAQQRSSAGHGVVHLDPSALPENNVADDWERDVDGARISISTVAHELGHVCGLPDEYLERAALGDAPLPIFVQSSDGKPFESDDTAMMKGNYFPRLHYLWHHVHALNTEPSMSAALHIAEGDGYVATHPTYGAPRSPIYALPDLGPKHRAALHPWRVIAKRRLHDCDLILYPLGDDESSRAGVFGKTALFLDGILLVRTKYWFEFPTAGAGQSDFKDDNARLHVMKQFEWDFHVPGGIRNSFVSTSPHSRLKAVGVLFQPCFEFAPFPQKKAAINDADLVVRVSHAPSHFSARDYFGIPLANVSRQDVGMSLQRLALGVPAIHEGRLDNRVDLSPEELKPLATSLSSMLSEDLPRTLFPFPYQR